MMHFPVSTLTTSPRRTPGSLRPQAQARLSYKTVASRRLRYFAAVALGWVVCSSVHAVPQTIEPGTRKDLSAADLERVNAIVAATTDFSKAEPFEAMQAGAGTHQKDINADAFSHPLANLDFNGRQRFLVGNGLFRKDWVSAPSSTVASDGLGPVFNARSCQACHVKDGRGSVPGFEPLGQASAMALLIRFAQPHPAYGQQFQPFSVTGVPSEGALAITYTDIPVSLNGGETVILKKPAYALTHLNYGPIAADTVLSPRLAPPVIGLGLLEAIHPADILANAQRAKPDGITGRPNRWVDPVTGKTTLGRFNWKSAEPTVLQQSAKAFSGDMGLSTSHFPNPYGDCTSTQSACLEKPTGVQASQGAHEVPDHLMEFVSFYTSNLAVPKRRQVNDPGVLNGKRLFYQANCVACHVPKYVTRRDAPQAEHRFQLIWPYTDLLVHDMGEGLADGMREGQAGERDWRTPPLWGIGLTQTVNPDATWLHDGRARTLLEAILWHAGEAQAARDRVVDMTPDERADLLKFLGSL